MHRSIITSAVALTAFAAVGGAASAPAESKASEPAPTAPAVVKPIESLDQLDALKKALKDRQTFPDFTTAFAALTKAAESTENFFGLPIAIVGYDAENDTVDESIYEGANAVLAYVGARKIKFGSGKDAVERNSIKSVVLFPIPTIESFLNATNEDGSTNAAAGDWLAKIIVKEASHVAFRNFRDANTVAELMNGAAAAPRSVDDYVTASNREGSGLDTETFDALWNSFRNMLKKDQPVLSDLLPGKAEVLKAIRSSAYASSKPELEPLEAKGIFARIGQALVNGAKQNKDKDGTDAPLDSSAIEAWLAERDTLVLSVETPKAKDFGALDSLDW